MIGVHSPTYGPKNDAIRYTLARAGVASETVSEILKCWTECFNANPNAHICWTCHSRAVVDTGNALKLFSPQLRQRITIIAVAPGSYISPHLCGSVTHLASKRDVVPLLDPCGMIRCWDTIRFLSPHSSAGVWDHEFRSKTYEKKLKALYYRFERLHP